MFNETTVAEGNKPGAMQVEIVESFEDLKDIQEVWDSFIEDVCNDIFMTFDWCRVWWKYYGHNRNLKVFVFRSDNEIVGIIPLFIEKIWLGPLSVKVVKIVGSDFTLAQFSLPIRRVFLNKVVAGLAENLKSLNWDIIHLGPIAGIYDNYVELKESLKLSFAPYAEIESNETQVQTYFEIESDWQSQLSLLSKNTRKNIKKNDKALLQICEHKGALVSSCAETEECIDAFEGFVELHQKHWNDLGKLGHFGDWPCSYEFHKEMAQDQSRHERLRMMVTKTGNEILGYEYAYKLGNKYFAILNSRLAPGILKGASLGISMVCEQIKMAIEEGVESIDAMRGHYDYKLRLGGVLYPIHSVFVTRKGFYRSLKVNLFRLLSSLYHICYYKIWFNRVSPKIFKQRRPLSRFWIRTQAFSK